MSSLVSTFGSQPGRSQPGGLPSQSASRSSAASSPLWGAAALTAIGAATAYALEQRRKRKEEAARQAAEAAAEAARRNAAEEARKVQNYLQSTAMLNAAMQNSNLSEAERAAIQAQAQTRGLAAALGLLGGLVTAAAERTRKQEERAEQRAARKEKQIEAEMQALSAPPQEWKAAAQAYLAQKALASFRAQEQSTASLPPKEQPRPWWLSSSLEGTARALAQTIPSAKIGSWRNRIPAFSWVSPGHVISFGKVNSGMLASDANPNLTLNPDGSVTPSVGKQPITSLTSRPNGFDATLRNPWQRYAFAEGTVKATLSSSVTARVTWGGFWNTTVGLDVNYPEVQVSGAGLKGRVSEGVYVEVKPVQVATAAVIVTAVVIALVTPIPDELAPTVANFVKSLLPSLP